jgi:hypothetical protein
MSRKQRNQGKPETDAEMRERIRARVDPLLAQYRTAVEAMAATPVDVEGGGEADEELDEHLWTRLSHRCESEAEIRALPDDLLAYFVTRLFEWSILHDGPEAFFAFYPELSDLVAPGYRHLGLGGAASAYYDFVASLPARKVLADAEYEFTDEEHAELNELWEAIGEHDADRIAFVRQRPGLFSI